MTNTPITLTEAITRANTRTLTNPHCDLCGDHRVTHEGITLRDGLLVTFHTCSNPACTGIRNHSPNHISRPVNGATP